MCGCLCMCVHLMQAGCFASARLSAEGDAVYCKEHMRAAGLVAAPSNKKKCTHEGCTRYVASVAHTHTHTCTCVGLECAASLW